MGLITLPSEQGGINLDTAQCEALFAWYRTPVSKQITAGNVLTIEGTGRYTVLPFTGAIGQITSIVVSQENVNGCRIHLSTQTVGHTVTLVHSANLRLAGGVNAELSTIFSSLELMHYGSGVWVAQGPVTYVP